MMLHRALRSDPESATILPVSYEQIPESGITVPVGNANQYAIQTSMGEVLGSGIEADQAILGDNNGTLFPPQTGLGYNPQNEETIPEFSLEQKFEFISVPIVAVYKFREGKFTPYAAAGIGVNYLSASSMYMNDRKVHYALASSVKQWSITSVGSIGVACRITSHFSATAEPAFRYSLTSLTQQKEIKWRPYSWLASLGMNYRF
jgi:opacity protein-like surface antigen